eukprot:607458-Rhodomonas_salina.1
MSGTEGGCAATMSGTEGEYAATISRTNGGYAATRGAHPVLALPAEPRRPHAGPGKRPGSPRV